MGRKKYYLLSSTFILLVFLLCRTSFVNADLSTGIIGYWKFDEGHGLVASDSSGAGSNATLVNNPAWTTGKIEGGISFDGTNDYVNAGKLATLNNLTSFTWSAWIYPKGWGENGFGRIIGKNTAGGFEKAFYLVTDGILRFNFDNSSGTNYQASSKSNSISLNTWQHVAVTFDYTGDKKPHLYINGAEAAYSGQNTMSGTPWNDSNYNLAIGNRMNTDRTFNGIIDDVRVYNRVLSVSEIQTLSSLISFTPSPTTVTVTPTTIPITATASPTLPASTVSPTGTTATPTAPAGCPRKGEGDADCDGLVDGVDYSYWVNSQCTPDVSAGQSCGSYAADFNGDGNVDTLDYDIWFENRGT